MIQIALQKLIYIYILAAAVFTVIDFVWLTKVAPQLYKDNIGHLMAERPNVAAAVAFYAIFLIGLLIFVIAPALTKQSLGYAIGYGALFGLVTYATFDLTSQAVLRDWPTKITLIDMAWGMILCTAVSAVTYYLASKFIV